MNVVRILLQVLIIAFEVFGISALMEFYKKNIRKDHAKVWEIRVIAGVLSCLAAVACKVTGLFTPIITAIFTNLTPWIDVVLYAVVIFFLQLEADLKTLKAIVKFSTGELAKRQEAATAEIAQLIKDFDGKSPIDARLIVTGLKLVGVTEQTVETYLKDLGADDDKAKVIIEAFKKALG